MEEATIGRWAVGGGEGYQRRKPCGCASSLPGGCACLRLRPLDLELGVDLGCAWIWAVQWMGKKEGGGARSECAARRRLLHLRFSVWEEDGCSGAGGMESRAPHQGRDGKDKASSQPSVFFHFFIHRYRDDGWGRYIEWDPPYTS